MAQELSLTVDAAEFRRAVSMYAKAFKMTWDEALRRQWRIVMQRVMGWTPPFHGRANNRQQAFQVGRAAILRDIFRTIDVIQVDKLRNEHLKELARSGRVEEFSRAAQTMGVVDNPVVRFTPSLHESQRDRRGRVRRSAMRHPVLDTDGRAIQEHVAEKLGNEGDAKSGWLPGLLWGGGEAQPWIARHAGRGHGTMKVNAIGDLTATNSAAGASQIALSRVRKSLKAQTKAMIREIERASQRAASVSRLT